MTPCRPLRGGSDKGSVNNSSLPGLSAQVPETIEGGMSFTDPTGLISTPISPEARPPPRRSRAVPADGRSLGAVRESDRRCDDVITRGYV